MLQDLSLLLAPQESLSATLYGDPLDVNDPLVIYVHGFKGFKDWAFVPTLGEALAARGIRMLAFNFSFNGIGSDGQSFTELEKFKANTLSRELKELTSLIEVVSQTPKLGAATSRIGLLGHSRGGGLAILAAAQHQTVKALCTWAAVSNFERFKPEQRAIWKKQGFLEVVNSRTGQVLELGIDMLKDVEKNGKSSLNILGAVQRLQVPYLILHGQADETVPAFEGEQLNIFANPNFAQFRLIPQASHTFNTKHPFEGPNPSFEEALTRTITFFEESL